MGWSTNTKQWYVSEYKRPRLGTDFYFYVGGIELASELAGGYRKALIRLVGFNQKVITVEEKNYLFKGGGG